MGQWSIEKTRPKKLNEVPPFSLMAYGPSGSGKTFMLSTFPSPLVLVTEPKEMKGIGYQGRSIDWVDCRDLDHREIEKILDAILNGTFAKEYKTIGFDGLTENDFNLRKGIKPSGQMTLPEWGAATDWRNMFCRRFAMIPSKTGKFAVMTALATLVKDELSGQAIGQPDTFGKTAPSIGAKFDLYLYLQQETLYKGGKPNGVSHTAYTARYGMFPANDSFGLLDATIDNTFDAVRECVTKPKVEQNSNPAVHAGR